MRPRSWFLNLTDKYAALALLRRLASKLRARFWGRHQKETVVWKRLADVLAADPVVELKEFQGVFAIGARSHLFRRIIVSGCYEPVLADWFHSHIDPARDVLDVGANVGFYSVLATRRLRTGRVWAIEPVDTAIQRLRENVAKNSVSNVVTVVKGVAAQSSGRATINIIPGLDEYSSLGNVVHRSVAHMDSESLEVAAFSIDDLVRREGIDPGIIKIDTEGAEEAVLLGSTHVLSTYRPIIMMEISRVLLEANNSSVAAVLSILNDQDYRIFDIEYPQVRIGARASSNIGCLPREQLE